MPHLSIVVPVYNEELIINELVRRLDLNAKLITEDFEIILIDDGSSDNTWMNIALEKIQNSRVQAIKFSRNFGQHYAITAGLNVSKGDWVIVMDGDLQDRPEVIPELYKKAQEGYDVVFVSRKNRPEPVYYKILKKTFYFILNLLSGLEFDSTQANFSIISKRVVEATRAFSDYSRFYVSTINWLGFNRSSISADHGTRLLGKPSYTFKNRIKLALDVILSFSERPLRFTIYLGSLLMMTSILGILLILIWHRNGKLEFSEWELFIVLSLFFNGILFIIIGVTGLYIGKIFQQVKARPLYVISDTIK